jgi:hypothetical protein
LRPTFIWSINASCSKTFTTVTVGSGAGYVQ